MLPRSYIFIVSRSFTCIKMVNISVLVKLADNNKNVDVEVSLRYTLLECPSSRKRIIKKLESQII